MQGLTLSISSFNRVPFGQRRADAELVDVYEVANGSACDCICPSCATPLVAKQGDVNAWHFAHEGRGTYQLTKSECDYSFFVSLRLMSIKLFCKCNVARAPKGTAIAEYKAPSGRKYCGIVIVTSAGPLRWDRVTPDCYWEGKHVDLLLEIAQYHVAVFFTHPEYHPVIDLDFWRSRRFGVLLIDLSKVAEWFAARGTVEASGGYRNCLANYLFESEAGKQWLTHPREHKAIERHLPKLHEEARRDSLLLRPANGSPAQVYRNHVGMTSQASIINPIVPKQVQADCVRCGRSWQGSLPGLNTCENCKTHLFVKITALD